MLKFSLVLENHVNLCYLVRLPFLNIADASLEFSNMPSSDIFKCYLQNIFNMKIIVAYIDISVI